MSTQRQQHQMQLFVVCNDHAAFHRGDVVAEERAEAAHDTKSAGMFAIVSSSQRFAIVLNKDNVATTDDLLNASEIVRIAQQVDGHDRARLVGDGCGLKFDFCIAWQDCSNPSFRLSFVRPT